MKTARIAIICNLYFSGSTQNSLKKLMRPRISTGVQNTMTVAIAIRMFAPHEAMRSCLRNMNTDATRQPRPTKNVTGWWSPTKRLS